MSQYDTYIALGVASTTISAAASIVLLALTYTSKHWNGLLLLIFWMSIFQLLFDFGFFFQLLSSLGMTELILAGFGQMIGGIATSLYSNVLAFAVLYIVQFRHVINIKKHFITISFCCITPGFLTFVVYTAGYTEPNTQLIEAALLGMNYYIRLISILFNLVVFFYSSFKLTKMLRDSGDSLSESNKAILSLVGRLKYYPLIQILARSGPSIDRAVNGISDLNNDNITPLKLYSAVTIPIAGLGYFIVYMCTQPGASKELWDLVTLKRHAQRGQSNNSVDGPDLVMMRKSPTDQAGLAVDSPGDATSESTASSSSSPVRQSVIVAPLDIEIVPDTNTESTGGGGGDGRNNSNNTNNTEAAGDNAQLFPILQEILTLNGGLTDFMQVLATDPSDLRSEDELARVIESRRGTDSEAYHMESEVVRSPFGDSYL